MALPRLNIGARFNVISGSLTERILRTLGVATVSSPETVVTYISSGSVQGSSTCTSSTLAIYSPTGVVSGSTTITTETVLVNITTGSATGATNIPDIETVHKNVVFGVATCTAETSVTYFSAAKVNGTSYVCARACVYDMTNPGTPVLLNNEIAIAASDSPIEDKVFADYICTGDADQSTIMTAIKNRSNRYQTLITGPIVLRFARGMYNCDKSFSLKDMDIIGSGSNVTVFEFKRPTTSPVSQFGQVLEMVVRTTGTTTLDSFMISAGGVLHIIYDDPTVFVSNSNTFNVNNVFATNRGYKNGQMYNSNAPGKINVEVAYPANAIQPIVIPEVYLNMSNCKVWDTDYNGFLIHGDRNNDRFARAFKDIYFINCHAESCGIRDDGAVVAGFHLLKNVSTENIRIQNCNSHMNWHCGFYFDDAQLRLYQAKGRKVYESNIVYNLFMENCKAYRNGHRSTGYTNVKLLPFCCGFVLREFASGDDKTAHVPQFITVDVNGMPVLDANGNLQVTVPSYPATLRDARGSYGSHDPTILAYGNIVNCYALNNIYAGFKSRGYNHNAAELNLLNCYVSGSQYSLVVDNQDGLYVEGLVSDKIASPTIMLKNVATINVQYMRVIDGDNSQFITFSNMDAYDNLYLEASKYVEVIS